MRMASIHSGMKKIDLVVTSARYEDAGERLFQAARLEHHGHVWSDTCCSTARLWRCDWETEHGLSPGRRPISPGTSKSDASSVWPRPDGSSPKGARAAGTTWASRSLSGALRGGRMSAGRRQVVRQQPSKLSSAG